MRPGMFSRLSSESVIIRFRSCLGGLQNSLSNTFVKMDLQDTRDIWIGNALVQLGSLRIGSMSRKAFCAFALACFLVVPALTTYAKKNKATAPEPPAISQMPDDQKIIYALNRLAYGPRPGEVEAVKRYGLDRWIEVQLHPESIQENPKLLAKLQPLDTLVLPANVMIDSYPNAQLIRAMVDGRAAFPDDPLTRMMIRRQVERYKIQEDAKVKRTSQAQAAQRRVAEMAVEPDLDAVLHSLTPEQQNAIKNGTPLEKVKVLEALPDATQIDVLDAMKQQQRGMLFPIASTPLRRRITILNGGQQVVYQDLTEGKLLRAVYSNKQLEEVLTDFWFNHFNVYFDKGADRDLVTSYERDVIRPNVLGKFHDLLLATAQSPAMLFYLDNWESVGANSGAGRELPWQGTEARAQRKLRPRADGTAYPGRRWRLLAKGRD